MEKLNLSHFNDSVILAEIDYSYHPESHEYVELLCKTSNGNFFIYKSQYLMEYSGLEWAYDSMNSLSTPDVKELLRERNMMELYETLFGSEG